MKETTAHNVFAVLVSEDIMYKERKNDETKEQLQEFNFLQIKNVFKANIFF